VLEALQPAQDRGWVLSYDGYKMLDESAVELRFAFGDGSRRALCQPRLNLGVMAGIWQVGPALHGMARR
jgi:hypothetical protein